MADSAEIITDFTVKLESTTWPIVNNQIRRSGPEQGGRTLKVENLGDFKSMFETALHHKSADQLGTFGKVPFDKKRLMLLSF